MSVIPKRTNKAKSLLHSESKRHEGVRGCGGKTRCVVDHIARWSWETNFALRSFCSTAVERSSWFSWFQWIMWRHLCDVEVFFVCSQLSLKLSTWSRLARNGAVEQSVGALLHRLFDSRPGDLLFRLRFSWYSSRHPGICWGSTSTKSTFPFYTSFQINNYNNFTIRRSF
jgi:hypothetical protein